MIVQRLIYGLKDTKTKNTTVILQQLETNIIRDELFQNGLHYKRTAGKLEQGFKENWELYNDQKWTFIICKNYDDVNDALIFQRLIYGLKDTKRKNPTLVLQQLEPNVICDELFQKVLHHKPQTYQKIGKNGWKTLC